MEDLLRKKREENEKHLNRVVAIVDPPRAGLHHLGIPRSLSKLCLDFVNYAASILVIALLSFWEVFFKFDSPYIMMIMHDTELRNGTYQFII
ncbi:hypothetical protein DVH05_025056 [Phytophthora capsici]|nr:hypothetical protein DVH05_025056 [Phytophthora capsici]